MRNHVESGAVELGRRHHTVESAIEFCRPLAARRDMSTTWLVIECLGKSWCSVEAVSDDDSAVLMRKGSGQLRIPQI